MASQSQLVPDQGLFWNIPDAGKLHFISKGDGILLTTKHGWEPHQDNQLERAMVMAMAMAMAMGKASCKGGECVEKCFWRFNYFREETGLFFLLGKEASGNISAKIAHLMLYGHFHRGNWDQFCTSLCLYVANLLANVALDLILADVDEHIVDEDRALIVVMDETLKRIGEQLDGKEARDACQDVIG